MRSNEFCDVTLVSGDNVKFEAHKVILAAYSNIFKKMLVKEKHPHPLIFMRVDREVLEALLNLIYCGEAKLSSEHLESFAELGRDIELQGVGSAEELNRDNLNAQENLIEQSKTCKHWNRGYCKTENCKYVHTKEKCEYHLSGGNCRDRNCHKRHQNTCRYWYDNGCSRKEQCEFLHQETYKSRTISTRRSRSKSGRRSWSRTRSIESERSRERSGSRETRQRNESLHHEDATSSEYDVSDKDDSDVNVEAERRAERDQKYAQNVANLRRIAKKFSMDIDLSDL
jgi:hypothetical protein